jgi:hypothetical protein
VRDEILLALAMAVLLAVVVALSVAGQARVARPLFMLAGLTLAMLARRRSPWLYLSASLWLWLTTAFVRRMLEWRGGFDATDIVLVTPNLAALPIVADILGCRGLLTRRGAGYALLPVACLSYGLLASLVRGDLLAGAIAAADWLVPLLYLFLFVCHARRIDEAAPHIEIFLAASLLFVVPYSLAQYFLMPDWDAKWMVASGMASIGVPEPMGARVFGPLNQPGHLAVWVGTCLVLLSTFRNRLLLALAPLLILVLALTMVRSVYGSVVLALAVGALAGRGTGGFARLTGVALLAGGVCLGMAVLEPQVLGRIGTRLQTLQNLSDDDSAKGRALLYAQTPGLIDDNPFGTGIGAQGRGNAVHRTAVGTVNIDSGPLSVFLALGWGAGALYIFALLLLQCHVLPVGRRRDAPLATAMAAAALCPLGTFPFINVLGFSAVVMWTCLGYALAVEIRAATPAPRAAPAWA